MEGSSFTTGAHLAYPSTVSNLTLILDVILGSCSIQAKNTNIPFFNILLAVNPYSAEVYLINRATFTENNYAPHSMVIFLMVHLCCLKLHGCCTGNSVQVYSLYISQAHYIIKRFPLSVRTSLVYLIVTKRFNKYCSCICEILI